METKSEMRILAERRVEIQKEINESELKTKGRVCLYNKAELQYLEKVSKIALLVELIQKCYYCDSITGTLSKTSYGFDHPEEIKQIKELMKNNG